MSSSEFTIDTDEAAQIVGVSTASIIIYRQKGFITSNLVRGIRLMNREQLEHIKALREEHGTTWYRHAPWIENEEAEDQIRDEMVDEAEEEAHESIDESEDTDEQEETEEAEDEDRTATWAEDAIQRAKQAKEEGRFEEACGLYDLVCSRFTFEGAE
jgi:preprotein translocase subunit SecA